MPVGVIINVISVFAGSLAGSFAGKLFPKEVKDTLTILLGYCAMTIALNSLINVSALPAVILATIVGYIMGCALRLEKLTEKFFSFMIAKSGLGKDRSMDMSLYITAVALFCCSGMGIFGVLTESITGDPSILISKSVLDFFTALFFAVTLGYAMLLIAAPQLVILLAVFVIGAFAARFIAHDVMLDFKACGGLITLATGFRVAKIKNLPVVNLIPALILVFPISWFWHTYIPF